MKVEYHPSNTTISCTFENELDSSQKSCSVEYGICDQAMNSAQNSTTDDSPSTVTIKLNITAMNSNTCYVVTATNGTFTVMVNGSFETPTNNKHLGVIVSSVILAVIMTVIIIAAVVVTVIVIKVLKRGMLLIMVVYDNNITLMCLMYRV